MKLVNIILALLLLTSCEELKRTLGDDPSESDPNVQRSYYDNGKLKIEVTLDSAKNRHGPAKTYYVSGELQTFIIYNHGQKDTAIQYYENGQKYMEFHYKNGLKHGLGTKYWPNGQLQSSQQYRENNPGGLKEFNKSGKELTKYRDLTIQLSDRLMSSGEYVVEISFSKKPKNAKYYIGSLEEGIFFDDKLIEIEKKNESGLIVYRPVPGTYMMKKMDIVGKYTTLYGNTYVVQKSVNVAFDF